MSDTAPIISELSATWAPQPGAVAYTLEAASPTWIVHVSPAVFDATEILAIPDLSNVAGWDQTLTPSSLRPSVSVHTGAPLEDVLRTMPTRPAVIRTVTYRF